jgi:septal ring factor EnvC (AmiA/AmiB activator)
MTHEMDLSAALAPYASRASHPSRAPRAAHVGQSKPAEYAAGGAPEAAPNDLSYRAAAADRASKIAALACQVENLRAERTELERRVEKLERRVERLREKLDRRGDEVRRLREELAAVLTASSRPMPPRVGRNPRLVRVIAGLARKARLRA